MTAPDSPAPGRWPAIVLLLAGAVLPGSAVALFKDEITRHPWRALLLLAAYEAAVLFIGLATKVWQKVEQRWVDRLAGWVDRWLLSLLSRYRRRYLDWVFYQHRDFDVKGLTTQGTYNLELEQVFVDLTLDAKPAHVASADLIRVRQELAGRRQIWDYLQGEASQGQHLAVIGAPGSGKTTLLKKIALQMTGRHRPRLRQTLPILLFLREHAEPSQKEAAYSLAAAVKSTLARKQGPTPPAGWFEARLGAGDCLVLLDGLDEVAAAETRRRVVAWVEEQMKAHAKNRFLITSRPHGYRNNPVSGVTILEVQPFTRQQIRRFVQNWYRANEIMASQKMDPGVEMKACEGTEDLLRRLGNSQTLTDLAVNPLLLTMIATVHRYKSSLPGRRVELYAEICEVFLGKRQRARGMETGLTPAQKEVVLQPLAYHLMEVKEREISLQDAVGIISPALLQVAGERGTEAAADFLQEIENGSGLLLEREAQVYSFAHLAFQEYLAAVHAREHGLGAELVARITDPWWHEVLRLYGAQGDASPILAACLSSSRPTVAVLSLAIDCLEEARKVDPEWREKVDSLLTRGVEDSDSERFRLAAETLLARRLRDMVVVSDWTFVDPAYVSHAEYQLFLDEMRAKSRFHQPDHWQEHRFAAGQARTPVVGVRPSDAEAFCEWLGERYPTYHFRLPRPGELAGHELREVLGVQGETAEGYWTGSEDGKSFERLVSSRNRLSAEYVSWLMDMDYSHYWRGILNSLAELARDLNLDLNLGSDFYHASFIPDARRPAPDFDRDHALDLDLSLDLADALGRDHDPVLLRNPALRSKEELSRLFRWSTRIFFLFVASGRGMARGAQKWWRLRRRDPAEQAAEEERRLGLSRYEDFVLLEARIDGELPAVEGIRLVKERRADNG